MNPVSLKPLNYENLIRFLVEPLLDTPEGLSINCESSKGNQRVLVRLAFETEDQGRVHGRGGRNIEAVRTVLEAAAKEAGQTVRLEIYGSGSEQRRSYGDGEQRRGYGDGEQRRSYGDGEQRRSYGDGEQRRSYGDSANGEQRRGYGDLPNRNFDNGNGGDRDFGGRVRRNIPPRRPGGPPGGSPGGPVRRRFP